MHNINIFFILGVNTMSQKKETTVILIAILVTAIVAIGGLLLLLTKFPINRIESSQENSQISPKKPDINTTEVVKEKISYGSKILIDKEESGDKNQLFQTAR